MSFDPFVFIEFWVGLAFLLAWVILEWQCKRLDRQRAAREQGERRATAQTATTHIAQEKDDSHGLRPPAG